MLLEIKKQRQLLLLLSLLHPFNGHFSGITWVSRYQKGKTSLDLNEARDDGFWGCSSISWTICKQSAPRFRQNNTSSLNFLQAGCSSWHPVNSVKALKVKKQRQNGIITTTFITLNNSNNIHKQANNLSPLLAYILNENNQ